MQPSIADLKALREDLRADILTIRQAQEKADAQLAELEKKYVVVAMAYQKAAQAVVAELEAAQPTPEPEVAPEAPVAVAAEVVEGLA